MTPTTTGGGTPAPTAVAIQLTQWRRCVYCDRATLDPTPDGRLVCWNCGHTQPTAADVAAQMAELEREGAPW